MTKRPTVTREMLADFDACMAALNLVKAESIEPFKADFREVVTRQGKDAAAAWIKGWRAELERTPYHGPVTQAEVDEFRATRCP